MVGPIRSLHISNSILHLGRSNHKPPRGWLKALSLASESSTLVGPIIDFHVVGSKPILLLHKGAQVIIGVASTIIACFEGRRFVDLEVIFYNTVKRMVSGIGGTKPSTLSPFLFHLYKATECLDAEEETYYKSTRWRRLTALRTRRSRPKKERKNPGPEEKLAPRSQLRQNRSLRNRRRRRGRQRRCQPEAPDT